MDKLVACRACCCSEVKLYKFDEHSLDKYFLTILGLDCTHFDKLPQYLCYECAWLVTKFYHFREKCLRAQVSYVAMLQSENKVKLSNIIQLHGQYTSKITFKIKPPNIFTYTHKEIDPKSNKFETDKNNTIFDAGHDYTKRRFDSGDCDDVDEVRDEERVAVTLSPIQESGSSDNENLDYVIVDNISDNEQNVIKPITSKMAAIVARKAIEENAMKEYVTIVTLSPQEQLAGIVARQHSSKYKNSPHKCVVCYRGFTDNRAFQNHILKHQPSSGNLACSICKIRFNVPYKLRAHSDTHKKRYYCKSCPFVSNTTHKAKLHQKWHKGVTYKCKHCSEAFTNCMTYNNHLRNKHPSEFICSVCGYSFVSKLGLSLHKTLKHKNQIKECRESAPSEPGPGRYCAECSMQFVSLEAYNRHMVTSIKHINITECSKCGITFDTGEELRLHRRKMHWRKISKPNQRNNKRKKGNKTMWPSKCTHCSEEIANAHCLWVHFRRKHPDQKYSVSHQYICELCGKGLTSKRNLVYHQQTHSEQPEYKCVRCPKAYFTRVSLERHKLTHYHYRPFPCDVCSHVYGTKETLERHYRSHSCKLCGKEFTDSSSRSLHIRTAHPTTLH